MCVAGQDERAWHPSLYLFDITDLRLCQQRLAAGDGRGAAHAAAFTRWRHRHNFVFISFLAFGFHLGVTDGRHTSMPSMASAMEASTWRASVPFVCVLGVGTRVLLLNIQYQHVHQACCPQLPLTICWARKQPNPTRCLLDNTDHWCAVPGASQVTACTTCIAPLVQSESLTPRCFGRAFCA